MQYIGIVQLSVIDPIPRLKITIVFIRNLLLTASYYWHVIYPWMGEIIWFIQTQLNQVKIGAQAVILHQRLRIIVIHIIWYNKQTNRSVMVQNIQTSQRYICYNASHGGKNLLIVDSFSSSNGKRVERSKIFLIPFSLCTQQQKWDFYSDGALHGWPFWLNLKTYPSNILKNMSDMSTLCSWILHWVPNKGLMHDVARYLVRVQPTQHRFVILVSEHNRS